MSAPSKAVIDATVQRTKAEIREDVQAGVVPADVESFGDLHSYVDANTYGGLCDEDGPWADAFDDDGIGAVNEVQNAVDAWIKAGGIAAAEVTVESLDAMKGRLVLVTTTMPRRRRHLVGTILSAGVAPAGPTLTLATDERSRGLPLTYVLPVPEIVSVEEAPPGTVAPPPVEDRPDGTIACSACDETLVKRGRYLLTEDGESECHESDDCEHHPVTIRSAATAPCPGGHVGACTTGRLFTHAEAEARLAALGFTFVAESAEWVRGEDRGRLTWSPDYCHPDNGDVGTRFYLSRPHRAGEIPLLPEPKDDSRD